MTLFFSLCLFLISVFALAAAGRWVALKVHQPAVLGELIFGALAGNILLALGFPLFQKSIHFEDAFTFVLRSANFTQIAEGALWLLSHAGVILLMFMVGLESRPEEMKRAGSRSLAVAVLGVVAPSLLSWFVSSSFLPDAKFVAHAFIATAACATSVGITARLLRDFGALKSREAHIILGAAVFDDILGLIVLAVVAGLAANGSIDPLSVLGILGRATLFIGLGLLIGERLVRHLLPRIAPKIPWIGRLIFPLCLCALMAWLAEWIGLAAIVGAFAAGLVIDEDEMEMQELYKGVKIYDFISPLEKWLAPVFFFVMGMQVNLASFMGGSTLVLAFFLSVAAVIGKLVTGLVAGKDINRWIVGVGMVPRGEVGLIFAGIGRSLGVLDDHLYAAILLMVVVTTFVTPPVLSQLLKSPSRQGA